MNIRTELDLANSAYEAEDFESAHKTLMAVIEAFPETAQAYQLLSLILRKSGNLKGAFDAIQRAITLEPDNAEFQNSLGTFYRMTRRNDLAIAPFKRAVDIAPNYLTAVMNLGDLYLQDSDPLSALAVFDGALEEHKDHPKLRFARALALKDTLQYERALAELQALPQTPDLALPVGQIFHETGQIAAAKNAFAQGLSHPSAGAAIENYKNLIMLLKSHEGAESAKAALDQILQDNTENLLLAGTSAQLLGELNFADEAKTVLEQADKKFGLHPYIAGIRGNLLIDDGKPQDAVEQVAAIAEKGPLDAALMSIAARANLMLGQADEAARYIRHARGLDPLNQYWIALDATQKRQAGHEGYGQLYNFEKFVRHYDLEPPAEYGDLDHFITEVTQRLMAMHDGQHHQTGQSLRGGGQTSENLIFAKDRVIQDFFQSLNAPLQDYMGKIGTEKDHILTGRNTQKHRFAGAWSVRLQGEGFHVNHVHPKGWISSSFYVQLPKSMDDHDTDKSGWIKFGEPSFAALEPDGSIQGPQHWVEPKVGRLVLFPSYMWHGTVPFSGDDIRLTLPFDAVPA